MRKWIWIIIVFVMFGCASEVPLNNHQDSWKSDDVLLISASSNEKTRDSVTLKSFDQTGNQTSEYLIDVDGVWKTNQDGDWISVLGGNKWIIVNPNTSEIKIMELSHFVGDSSIYLDHAVFTQTIRKDNSGNVSEFCLVSLSDFNESNAKCIKTPYHPLDIVMNDEKIYVISGTMDEDVLIEYDLNFNELNQTKIAESGSYFVSEPGEKLMLASGTMYYFPEDNLWIESIDSAERFTFVQKCSYGLLRTDIHDSKTSVHFEEIVDSQVLRKTLFESKDKKIVVNSVNSSVFPVETKTSENIVIEFYSVFSENYLSFHYETDDDEEVLGAYVIHQKINTGKYQNEGSIEDEVSLTLNEDHTFSLSISMLSSWIGTGSYEVEGNELVLKTEKYIYIFEISNNKLIYDKEASIEHSGAWEFDEDLILSFSE